MRKLMVIVLSLLIVLSLYVVIYASEITSFLQTKDNWGENGLTLITVNLNPFSSDPQSLGIRIDGSYGVTFLY